MNWNILYIIIWTTTLATISKVHCKGGGGRIIGGGGKTGGSKTGGWSGKSKNSYKSDYTPTHYTWHSDYIGSASAGWDSPRNSYKPHYTHSHNMPSYNYQNFYSDSSNEKDYNSFLNGYITGRILADISKPNEREFHFQSSTEKPLDYNNFHSQFDTSSYESKIVLPGIRTQESKFIFGGPAILPTKVNIEATSTTAPSLENIKLHTNEDQNYPAPEYFIPSAGNNPGDSIKENCEPLEATKNKIIKKDISTTTLEPNLETTTKWYYRKLSSTTSIPKYINCRRVMNSVLNDSGEIIDTVTEICDPPPTTTTTKPIVKITTEKPMTTTAKPYITVCRPVMNSSLNEHGEIIDTVNEVCTLKPVP